MQMVKLLYLEQCSILVEQCLLYTCVSVQETVCCYIPNAGFTKKFGT